MTETTDTSAALFAGKDEIEDDAGVLILGEEFFRLQAVGGEVDFVAFLTKPLGHRPPKRRMVLRNQKPRFAIVLPGHACHILATP